jgi:hypothetical protein
MKICAILVKVLQQTKENCSNALALSLVFDLPSVIVYQRRREVRKFEGAGGGGGGGPNNLRHFSINLFAIVGDSKHFIFGL